MLEGVDIFRLRIEGHGGAAIYVSGRLKQSLEDAGCAKGLYFVRVAVYSWAAVGLGGAWAGCTDLAGRQRLDDLQIC